MKLTDKITKILNFGTVAVLLWTVTACSSIPKSSRYFLENEGSPLKLEDLPSSENINGDFPDTIWIKTQTQSFSFEYEFLLFNGRVYYKKRGTDKSAWEPLLGTGLPHSSKNKFPAVKRVVEIAADADVLYAFSDEGQLYRCYTKKITSYTPFEWVDYFGWPIKMPLYQNEVVRNKKAWAVGSSRLDVEYYEDICGNQHNYGPLGVESIPFLCEDGQTIHYSDPACPSDLSHSFRTPDGVQLENFSESASTYFAITKDGRMYTRLVDFNTVGSNPMLYDYSYEEVYSSLPGSNKKSNTTLWVLPNAPWKMEPPLPNGAKSTTYVTIIQTGKGNSARELRVAAINPQGKTGFYYKNLDDTIWQFKEAPLTLPANSFTTDKAPAAKDNLLKYSGGLWKNGQQIDSISCSINDFHFSEGPCTLVINNKFNFQFYYSEIWTLFLRLNPGYSDESIRYFGTAVFDEALLSDSAINPEIKEIFTNRNKSIHDFFMEAYDSYFRICITVNNNLYEFYMTKDGSITINPDIDRTVIQKANIFDERLEEQKQFFKQEDELFKAQKKISKNKKSLSGDLRSVIRTKKGKKHPVVKLFSKKVAIILKYSGEICKVNKDYYKENHKLNKKYSKAIIRYNQIMDINPDFNASETLKDYVMQNPKYTEKGNIIFINNSTYNPCFVIQTKNGYNLYNAKKGAKGIYNYYIGEKSKIKIKKTKFRYK